VEKENLIRIKEMRETALYELRRQRAIKEANEENESTKLERFNTIMHEVYLNNKAGREPEEEIQPRHYSGSSNSKTPWATKNEGYANEEVQSSHFVDENDDYGMFLQKEMEENNSPQKQEYKSYSSVVQSPPRKNKEITPPTNPPNTGAANTKGSDKPYQNFIIHEGQSALKIKRFQHRWLECI
jgi:hypothetical protein